MFEAWISAAAHRALTSSSRGSESRGTTATRSSAALNEVPTQRTEPRYRLHSTKKAFVDTRTRRYR